MNKQVLKDGLGWGLGLWLIGYVLGIVFFAFVPAAMIGWVIMPIGIALTLWVAFKRIKGDRFQYFVSIAAAWLIIAVLGDYFLIVKTLKPADGYYKLDVYIYYVLTAAIPVIAGWKRRPSR